MSVLYVAVNYRTTHHATEFLRCFSAAPEDTIVVLVDNTEPDRREALDVSEDIPCQPKIVGAPTNLGYFGGARLGLSVAQADGIDPDWLVVSNVDVRFAPREVADVLSVVDAEQVGVVAPSIRSSLSGVQLNPFMAVRPSRWRMQAYRYVFRSYWSFALYTALSGMRPRRAVEAPGQRRAVYAPHGAFMALSRKFFSRGGTLDHEPFLYGEEITIAETAARLALRVEFVPEIRVVHEEHASTSRLPSRVQHKFVRQALTHVAQTHFR